MPDSLIRAYVVIGLFTFGLRGVLPDLNLPAWSVMLSFALGIGVVYGIYYLTNGIRHLVSVNAKSRGHQRMYAAARPNVAG